MVKKNCYLGHSSILDFAKVCKIYPKPQTELCLKKTL